jgi:DNA/RNA endonuclease YhcR with UshA esterase domain
MAMRMQKEEKIVFVLLLMALVSLAVAFWAFPSDEGKSESFDGSEIGTEYGNAETLTSVEGIIVDIKPTKGGGHLMISLDETALKIFISRSAGAEELSGKLKKGDRIRVEGVQKEYQGQEELEVSRISDVQILN